MRRANPQSKNATNDYKAHCCIVGELVRLMTIRDERHDNDENCPGGHANSLLQLG